MLAGGHGLVPEAPEVPEATRSVSQGLGAADHCAGGCFGGGEQSSLRIYRTPRTIQVGRDLQDHHVIPSTQCTRRSRCTDSPVAGAHVTVFFFLPKPGSFWLFLRGLWLFLASSLVWGQLVPPPRASPLVPGRHSVPLVPISALAGQAPHLRGWTWVPQDIRGCFRMAPGAPGCLWVLQEWSWGAPGAPWWSWVLQDVPGYSRMSLGAQGCPQVLWDFPGCPMVVLGAPGCPWVPQDSPGCPRMSVDSPGHPQALQDTRGCRVVSVGAHIGQHRVGAEPHAARLLSPPQPGAGPAALQHLLHPGQPQRPDPASEV